MALNLLDSFGRKGVNYGLATRSADVIDTDFMSKYFVVSDFKPTFSAGKNSFSFNGSRYLKDGSEVLIEAIDSQGQAMYVEMATYADISAKTYAYKEGTAWCFSIHVYNDTADGIGKLTLYGVLGNDKTVKWQRNITIDKTQKNTSKVKFYLAPSLEVDSVLVPVLAVNNESSSVINKTLSGTIHSLALVPSKDTNLPSVNARTTDIDYQFTIDTPTVSRTTGDIDGINSQMKDVTVNLIINTIQQPFSVTNITPTEVTGTFTVSNVINNSTFQTTLPYYYKDGQGNYAVTNIVSANYSITYPFVTYNNSASTYLTTSVGATTYIVKNSYADITYKGIRTFSGYVARHKVYRKSLSSTGDFSVIADEPVTINEILRDNLTQNKYYEYLGKFYNDAHISRYWFTSSTALSLTHTPDVAIDSMWISSPVPSALDGTHYLMVKNDSVRTQRNATYVPYDAGQWAASSGSSYDSNFMEFKANVQYLFEVSTTIEKNEDETSAGLQFFITSSIPAVQRNMAFTTQHGLKVAELKSTNVGVKSQNFNKQLFFFTPSDDIYGTLVVVPYRCQAYMKNMSFRVYGDDGFSPDAFTTRIPWPISTANESYEIKAELFDVNQNLIYSGLRIVASFDPSGSSLIPYNPSGGSVGDLFVQGNLTVSKSIDVQKGNVVIEQGNLYVPGIGLRPGAPQLSASRFLSVRHDNAGQIVENPIVDIDGDDSYLYLSQGPLPGVTPPAANAVTTHRSLTCLFDTNSGRRIYYNGECVAANKVVDKGTYS